MSELSARFKNAARAVMERDFSRMNDMQRQAVFTTEGAVLILAGAGSGKTTVLINRAACLLKYGSAYDSPMLGAGASASDVELLERVASGEDTSPESAARAASIIAVNPPRPWQIMTITFTNKAAGELKERLSGMLGEQTGGDIWAHTFHSSCTRILRRWADRIGYTPKFTIYDSDDQKRLVKAVMNQLNISDRDVPVKAIMNEISRAKDSMLSPSRFEEKAGADYRLRKAARVYTEYQRRLQEADAMDFDDLLLNTVTLFEQNEDVLDYYRSRFRYIMVDEYQDTNLVQYRFVSLLAGGHGNLCVVGDDDQSIYKFRGATIENILNFEKHYKNARVIRLEQNYRSTQNILDAANCVIQNNLERKGKELWTQNGRGDKITLYTAEDERDEAAFIASTVTDHVAAGGSYSDCAVLYRMNSQSNAIENHLMRAGVPYRVLAGHRFFDRKEIRDIIAYFSVIANPADEMRLTRIINEPKRGIGEKSVQTMLEIASGLGVSALEVMREAGNYPALGRSAVRLKEFAAMIDSLAEMTAEPDADLCELLERLLDVSGYREAIINLDERAEERLDNIKELSSTLRRYQTDYGEEASLEGFLEEVALISDIDNYDRTSDSVVLMTLHAAKGLEFPLVFIPGMEEGVFPGMQTILDPTQVEEERRLAYVGITRAKKKLYLLCAKQRTVFGQTSHGRISRFAAEIHPELVEKKGAAPRARTADFGASRRESAPVSFGEPTTAARTKTASTVIFEAGGRVRHKVFGFGTIVSAKPMGGDTMLEIHFDKVGVKRLMANFAGLTPADE